ncbi:MAG: amino acid adenylation domain-containing protein [Clostridia bacterium]|nr:amino acid adenylation domain-containing protein [Clostridia bacterium]
MSILEFLTHLRELGVKLWLEEGALRYQAPKGVVSKELLGELSNRKNEVISFLKQVKMEAQAVKEPIKRISRDEGEDLPLSFSQQSMWFFDQFTKGNPVFNISNAVKMSGIPNKEAIRKSLEKLVERHESLRTTFKNVNGSPVQVINKKADVDLAEVDLSHVHKKEIENKIKLVLKDEARRIFDLEKGPLFRFCLFKTGEEEYVFSMTIHHIISDAWSNAILVGEFFKLYEAFLKEKNLELPLPEIEYADYSSWERNRLQGETLEELLSYWRKQLANPLTLQLPTDYPRPKSQSYEGGFETFRVSRELSEKLKSICNKEGVTMFMLILTAFQALLCRYSGQTDIFTGTVVANRNRKEVESLVGYFMNTLVMRTNFENDPCFTEVLNKVKQMTIDAYTYQELPFDKLLEELKPERDVSRTPLFQVMFILHTTQKVELDLPGLKMEQLAVESGMSPFDLRLQLTETDQGLKGGFDYNTSLFSPSTVERIGYHLLNILESIAANPEVRISKIKLLTEKEERQILEEFNNTDAEYPEEKVIYEFFEEHALKNPDDIAASFGDKQLTYKELNEKANQIARILCEKGMGQESIIGILLERSLEMIIGIMAVVKAGGAYLPIDPHNPQDRINYILEDSNVSLLLSHKKFSDIHVGEKIEKIYLEDEALYTGDKSNLAGKADPHGLAYVIYTSGSTGKPKGTLIEHHSLVNRLNWMQKMYPLIKSDTILQKTPYTFDVSVWEMFWWAMQGAKVCFLEPGAEKDPGKIVKAIEENMITVMHFVPSMLNSFLEYLKDTGETGRVASLKQVFASGEALTAAQVSLFKNLLAKNGTKLANLYGPTEATIDVSYFDCITDNELDSIPIGKPIDNIRLYVMDSKLQLQPVGVPGELCIAGVGLARGYLNRPELTSEKFADNPLEPGKKLYRTGDLAKWREDGNIEYLGRIDFQVKIRGLRIELGEIERVLIEHPSVKDCIVTAWEKQPGNMHLVGYIVCEKDTKTEIDEIKAFLGKALPEYMVPKLFVFLDAMPLSQNGKADRKALPLPELEKKTEYVAPKNELESILANIWKEELGLENVGINDNFFEIGGHSLLLTRVHNRLNKQFQREFSLIDLFTHSTICALAKYISGENAEPAFLKNEDRLQRQKEAKLMRKQLHRRG